MPLAANGAPIYPDLPRVGLVSPGASPFSGHRHGTWGKT